MQIAERDSLVDRLYREWRGAVAMLAFYQAELNKLDENDKDEIALRTEDVHQQRGRVEMIKYALAIALHVVEQRGDLMLSRRINWTFGSHLADQYHDLWQTQLRAARVLAQTA